MPVTPFQIHVPDEVLADLQHRLSHTRWPDEIPGSEWDYGSNLDYIKELTGYWRNWYDWRAQEAALNAFPHFKTAVDGQEIHFIHQRGRGESPMPLIVTHGWPSTFFEMTKIIPRLTDPAAFGGDPADSFDVVVPSMPGYGFSAQTRQRGVNTRHIAGLWAKLMTEELGYNRFAAQGGDWGAGVTARLGYHHADHIIGIHVTSVTQAIAYQGEGSRPLDDEEKALLEQRAQWQQAEGGYSHIQGTKPQTLSYGLNDSPVGLCAWIVEKFRTWSDCNGDVESRYTRDELLNTVMLYWVTQTINSSTRLYYENQRTPWNFGPGDRINVPCAVALFPGDLSRPPRQWAERCYNVQRWTEMPRGGHFAALEEPDLLVEDIRAFFRNYR